MPDSFTALAHGPSRSEIERVARQLRRLEAIAERHRLRRRVIRLVRGGAGGGATLLVLMKAKIAASLSAKLVLAALVGLGFAWPLAALAVFVLITIVASLFGDETIHCDGCDCLRANPRRARLRELIAQRRAWLAEPTGAAPRIRDGRGPARR